MWLLALLHWNFSLILTDYNEGGGHGVCETLRLATCFDAIECFSNEAILINYTGREEVLEFARFCAWLLAFAAMKVFLIEQILPNYRRSWSLQDFYNWLLPIEAFSNEDTFPNYGEGGSPGVCKTLVCLLCCNSTFL